MANWFHAVVLSVALLIVSAAGAATTPDAGQMVFMLKHMQADYPQVVEAGRITDAAEYAEQKVFATTIRNGIAALPAGRERDALVQTAQQLARAVEAAAPPAEVLPVIEVLIAGLDPAGAGPTRSRDADETPLAFSARAVAASLGAYRDGNRARAYQLAGDAYLEGFELAEQALAAANHELKEEIEHGLADYRGMIHAGAPLVAVATAAQTLQRQLADAGEALATTKLSPALSFGASFVILLREGLEAILVLAAVVAFVRRAERPQGMRYVHGGWIGALAAGALTWLAAAFVLDVSGATREVSEGAVALVAAGMLFYVGFWLHDKAHAKRWQAYIHDKLQGAAGRRALWVMAAMAFVAVYREVFETILFYQALWMQTGSAGQTAVLAGLGAAVVALAALAWALLRLSARLPLGLFFRTNALLLFALAVVFAGKGVVALQEAGSLPVDTIGLLPRIEALGFYPTLESVAAQVLLLGAALYVWLRPAPARAPA